MILQSFTRETIATIRRNAGKVTKEEIAEAVGVSLGLVERIAREQNIDLRLIAERPDDPAARPLSSREALTGRPGSMRKPDALVRTEQVTTMLTVGELAAVDAVAAKLGLKRSRVVSRVIETARARGVLEEMARLPAAPVDLKSGGE